MEVGLEVEGDGFEDVGGIMEWEEVNFGGGIKLFRKLDPPFPRRPALRRVG